MLSIKVVYNDKCEEAISNLLAASVNPMFEFFNEDDPKQLKKAWKYKGEAGAKQIPFIGVYEDKELIKAFYKEDNSYKDFLSWLREYILSNAKKGWMTIKKLEGVNNEFISVGSEHSGHADAFIEGIPLFLESPTDWFRTSIIRSINWEDKTFQTLNSTYSFTLNEETSESQNQTRSR